MNLFWMAVTIGLVVNIVPGLWLWSLVFRRAYLRQKIENLRSKGILSSEWFEQISKVDDDFWSFLK